MWISWILGPGYHRVIDRCPSRPPLVIFLSGCGECGEWCNDVVLLAQSTVSDTTAAEFTGAVTSRQDLVIA